MTSETPNENDVTGEAVYNPPWSCQNHHGLIKGKSYNVIDYRSDVNIVMLQSEDVWLDAENFDNHEYFKQ